MFFLGKVRFYVSLLYAVIDPLRRRESKTTFLGVNRCFHYIDTSDIWKCTNCTSPFVTHLFASISYVQPCPRPPPCFPSVQTTAGSPPWFTHTRPTLTWNTTCAEVEQKNEEAGFSFNGLYNTNDAVSKLELRFHETDSPALHYLVLRLKTIWKIVSWSNKLERNKRKSVRMTELLEKSSKCWGQMKTRSGLIFHCKCDGYRVKMTPCSSGQGGDVGTQKQYKIG